LSDVLVKNVDEKLYARLKAEAASERKSVGQVFNEAVRAWLASRRYRDLERELNVRVYLKVKGRMAQHPNDYFVIAKGEYLGHYSSLREAFGELKKARTTKGLVLHSQSPGEWLGGALEA
jgi:plasmid stability protein